MEPSPSRFYCFPLIVRNPPTQLIGQGVKFGKHVTKGRIVTSGRVSQIFVGRQREMAELRAALDDAMSGRGRLVMLAGEPGIGKTRIAQELASHAESLGAQVLWGRCYEQEGVPPYWPWVQPIRSYVRRTDPEQLRSEMGAGAADMPK